MAIKFKFNATVQKKAITPNPLVFSEKFEFAGLWGETTEARAAGTFPDATVYSEAFDSSWDDAI